MPKYIIHRVNTLKSLKSIKNYDGFECDINHYKGKIVLQHDSSKNKKGESFENFIKKCDRNKLIILNIKTFGLVKKLIKKSVKKNILFLDPSFSEIDYCINNNFSKYLMLRHSIYEQFKLNNKYFKSIRWIWVDFFKSKFLSKNDYKYIKKNNKKICLVSPELLGKKNMIIKYIKHLNKNKIHLDAVCLKKKFISLWKENYNY